MQFSLKTRFTLSTSAVVLLVATTISTVYLATLVRQVIRQTTDRARFTAQQVFLGAQHALAEAADRGEGPTSSSEQDLRDYVGKVMGDDQGLGSLIEGAVGYSATIYEITIAAKDDTALVSSDPSLVGRFQLPETDMQQLADAGFATQLRVLYGPPRVYQISLPFNLGGEPFGDVRVGLSTAFLRNEISPRLASAAWVSLAAVLLATLIAAFVSHMALRPLAQIQTQLDRISAGEAEVAPIGTRDELGQVSTKISRIGQELRDVRGIFSTLRENLNRIMTGLEDGLLLFSSDGRVVLASPSVETFLGKKPEALVGRNAGEVFPDKHPLARALGTPGGRFHPVEAPEVLLDGAGSQRRAAASVQVIHEGEGAQGALVTLRDLESREEIGSQLQVSERLAAIGKVTAGVAHEVKNPLNSMRVWLEILRGHTPTEGESGQALAVLNSEINRLDRVVKTFLDFSRPMELKLEETDAAALLDEVMETMRPQFAAAGVEASVLVPKNLPPVRLDRELFQQALVNLVGNAMEAAGRGGRIFAGARPKGDKVELTVTDNGPGIPEQYRSKIFQLFFTTKPGGTGIGLAATFRIVQLHNGSIDFTSEEGRGTTFRIELVPAR